MQEQSEACTVATRQADGCNRFLRVAFAGIELIDSASIALTRDKNNAADWYKVTNCTSRRRRRDTPPRNLDTRPNAMLAPGVCRRAEIGKPLGLTALHPTCPSFGHRRRSSVDNFLSRSG
ncbi:hypothetical protein GN244_ATG06131 [Phytophthora infestans]|uniref:Uncharacterized protein n=1 Tax=Phytophthora infestans TaxID=4787 RepID=A0A833T0Z2_PHYIN|nr:hypothetical protein GN244_ATG06131 [Phytophthora infestans]KAF4146762.1 hypothetical protein GN958_ATG04016 [Phytophthora infestans]